MYLSAFHGRTVLVTGHTGFKGSWLTIYLRHLGARVVGYALAPPTEPNLFTMAGLEHQVTHLRADIRDTAQLREAIATYRPDFIFHLAAQPLVLESYRNPQETFSVNVMGTLSLLEALRSLRQPCHVVLVTTDKCYENRGWPFGYRETDALGGHDPYSASKAAMEIVAASYRASFFDGQWGSGVRIATARAGNVIGGGDWSLNRIVPDAVRALHAGQPLRVRHPQAVRPWQHVLEPLSGYLWLAARLAQQDGEHYADAWNFGPLPAVYTVARLADEIIRTWGGGVWTHDGDSQAPHEAHWLSLSIDKALSRLGWSPVWGFETTVQKTVHGYQRMYAASQPAQVYEVCQSDIDEYEAAAAAKGAAWTS